MLVTSTADFFAPPRNRAVRRIGAGAVLALVAACSGDDTKVTTGSGTTGTSTSSTVAGSTTTSTTTTSGAGVGGSMGSGGSGGSTTGATGSGGASAGGAGGSAGGSTGASGAGGSGGAGGGAACNTSPGKALQFNRAVVDFMNGDLGADLPGGDTPRTIELWAQFLSAASWTPEGSIIETGRRPDTNGMANMVFGIDLSGYNAGTMTAEFGPYTNGFSDNNDPNGVFVPMIPQMGWLHLSWSYTGNHGTLSFTVNGVEYPVITTGGQPTMNFTPGIITLGASQSFGTGGWTGVMDELRIWRVARTPQQILDNMRVVLRPTEPGLVAYYRFEGSGTFTDDESMTMSHRLSTCTAGGTPRCTGANAANPMFVTPTQAIPGTFTCAP